MAEDNIDKQAEQGGPDGRTDHKRRIFVGGILASVMLLEAGAIVVTMKFTGAGAPRTAVAGGLEPASGAQVEEDVEVAIAEFKAPNEQTGRVFVYDVKVCALVSREHRDALQQILEKKKETIADRLNSIMRSAKPQHLQEDKLDTLRRQIKYVLDKVVGDDNIIREILIPRFMKFRADY